MTKVDHPSDKIILHYIYSFPNLGVQHVKKMNIVKVLHEKLCQQYQVDSCLNLDLENVNSFDIATLVESFGSGGLPLADQSLATVVEGNLNPYFAHALPKSLCLRGIFFSLFKHFSVSSA